MRRVLITGVGGGLGALLARQLDGDAANITDADGDADGGPAREPTIIGLDLVRPRRRWRRLKFLKADLRQPATVELIRDADPDLVLHFAVRLTSPAARSRQAHDSNVIGTMNLLAGCRGARRFVVESSVAVYPPGSGGPSVLEEDDALSRRPGSRAAADLLEIEAMLADHAVENPASAVTLLRFGTILGPAWRGPMADYLRLESPPTVLGFDPRLQLLSPGDAVAATCRAASADHPGTFNVTGPGAILLSRLLKLGGRSGRPLLPPLAGHFLQAQAYRLLTQLSPPRHFFELLNSGQVVDTARLAAELHWQPEHSSGEVASAFFQQDRLAARR